MSSRYLTVLATATALSALTFGAPVYAADFKSTEDFATKAAVGNMFEIKSSQLALERSKDPQVRALAEKMIADHTKSGHDLEAALTASKIDKQILPKRLDEPHQKIYDTLVNIPADKFDEEYMEAQEDAHEETIALFKSYNNSGDSTSVKQFAKNTLPTLESHARHVEQIDDGIDD